MALVTPHFDVGDAHVDESSFASRPRELAGLLADAKAQAASLLHPRHVVIGCDTIVDLDGVTLGKPAGRDEAFAMLAALSGRSHKVHTGVSVYLPQGTSAASFFVETTEVCFLPISCSDIKAYIATDDPYDKAGGYGIQGWAARFIPHINGCYYNVMGLPVAALYQALFRLNLLSST